MKTILVTGGVGMIGSHLCLKLLKQGNQVYCIDNLISGNPENLKDLKRYPSFIFIKQSINQPINIKQKINEIYNLASTASPIYLSKYPIEILMTGSIGVKNVLDLALKMKAKFLHASSSEVYGDPKEHPQKETYWGNVNPIGPRSCYDEAKRFAESLIENYRRKYKLKTKIVRIFNTYGPRIKPTDGKVVPNFIQSALANKKIAIYGNGLYTRSFCYVSDMVDGLIKMMASDEHGPINLGNPQEYRIIDLAGIIIKMTKSKSKIVFLPKTQDDPIKRKPDITLAKKRLNWQPKISLENGLLKTIAFYKN